MRHTTMGIYLRGHHLLVLLVPLSLACQSAEQDGAPKPPGEPSTAALPTALILEDAPEGALNVIDAKESAKEGEAITVRGRVGGSVRPFVEGRAVFTVVGRGPHACSDHGDDHCATGWDYCCTPPEVLRAHSATIRVVDDDGRPIRAGVRGLAGIEELSDVSIVGTVSSADHGALIVDAAGIFVNPPEAAVEGHDHEHGRPEHDRERSHVK